MLRKFLLTLALMGISSQFALQGASQDSSLSIKKGTPNEAFPNSLLTRLHRKRVMREKKPVTKELLVQLVGTVNPPKNLALARQEVRALFKNASRDIEIVNGQSEYGEDMLKDIAKVAILLAGTLRHEREKKIHKEKEVAEKEAIKSAHLQKLKLREEVRQNASNDYAANKISREEYESKMAVFRSEDKRETIAKGCDIVLDVLCLPVSHVVAPIEYFSWKAITNNIYKPVRNYFRDVYFNKTFNALFS